MTLLATFKHISSKNADYGAAEAYLTFEHDEFTMKPTLDENGRLIPREDYRISSLNCGGEDFAVACMRANLRYEKNQKREDVKSHHYIISFDPRDGTDNGLTVDRAQELGEQFCKEHFPGHQALVCTHPDGHNHSGNTAKAAKKAAEKAEKAGKYVWEHRRGFAIAAAILLMLAFLLNGLSSCSVIMDGVGSGIAASTYPSQDADMLGAEAQYCAMEAELQRYLDTYESTHDYDEYHFDLDTIEHDPYVLISMITALHQGEWTLDEVQGTLQMLFDRQYILTEDVVVETRYRTETDTWTDADGNTHTDTYQVPYDYYICTVTLENFNLSHVPVYIMSEEQLGMYATYMATLGNRPDLFPGSGYIGKYVESSYTDYDIPPEALDDEVFAAIIKEAEKYLGYPYVWGGSSPSTSFDCSGFVSWVINHSGWDVGRLGAQGLCNICMPVSSANVKPGDLVFFTGTYDTPGVSHVGIYVGNNMMIHCGDPISYANLNSSYWQSHFYRYGRLP